MKMEDEERDVIFSWLQDIADELRKIAEDEAVQDHTIDRLLALRAQVKHWRDYNLTNDRVMEG